MRRFIFRLETVLQHRATIETLCEQEFGAAQGRMQTLQTRLSGLQAEFERVVAARPGNIGEPFDAHEIFDRERYLETLQAAISQQIRRVEAARIVVEEKRQALLLARQAREAVAQLREKDMAAHTAHGLQVEQTTLDELATLRHVRANLKQAA